ncbi:hypothetical protein MNBD_NITROSPIRAE02-793 [hydrothermal vent metagenome]|uniref:Uncharacterized protein n=1 Tax=hydrothermal vent metagenome TaxID=652676 RepID=A0A3B1D5I8_9ZZZZ
MNKDIEVITLHKNDYADIVSSPAEELNLQELIDKHEQLEADRKKKKKKSSKTTRKKNKRRSVNR